MARPQNSQRGMAVIAALVVVAAAAALAAALIERQSLWLARVQTEASRAQALQVLYAGLDWSRLVLLLDARQSPQTKADGLWAQTLVDVPLAARADSQQALFSGLVEDAQAKFDLNGVARAGQIVPQQLARLRVLLRLLGQDEAVADLIAQRVASAQARAGVAPTALGLRDLADLAALPGITPDLLRRLDPYLGVLPEPAALNINTATPEALAAVLPAIDLVGARELVEQRARGLWFVHRGDIRNRLAALPDTQLRALDVRSDWFRVSGEVRLNDTIVALQALLHRDGQGRAAVRWVRYD